MARDATPPPGVRAHLIAPAQEQDVARVAEEHRDDVGRFVVGHTPFEEPGTD
jgi:hypothetical protein